MQLLNKQASRPPHVHITIVMQPPSKITARKMYSSQYKYVKYLEYFDKDGYFQV